MGTWREAPRHGFPRWDTAYLIPALHECSSTLVWEQASLAMSLEEGSQGWADARGWDCVSQLGPRPLWGLLGLNTASEDKRKHSI